MRVRDFTSALLSAAAALPLLVLAQSSSTSSKLLNYTEAFTPGWVPKLTSVAWVDAENADGAYIETDPVTASLILKNIVTGVNETFVDASKLGFQYYDSFIQPSRKHVLFAANYTKQYRHSYFANYFIFNRDSGSVVPLVADQAADIQYAEWSPVGDTIAFVRKNDLYLWKNGTVTRVTNDGGPDVFNGVPDWVYEEEIFSDRFTLWFSPDGEYLAFLRMNETGVPTYTVPYYMAGQTVAPPYPKELEIRYPKVSETNPTVTFNLLKIASVDVKEIPFNAFAKDDLIIGEVAWVADHHENVIFRAFNRVQDKEKLVLVDVATGTSKVVRERDGTDGWLDNNIAIQYIGTVGSGDTKYYIDLSDHTGWNHLYLYPVKGGEPKALTQGEWEVASIVKIDAVRELVYYLSTERHSTERHLYSVHLATGAKKALVDTNTAGWWGASFSARGGYYILSYTGPSVPYQELYSINSTTPLQTINDNAALKAKLAAYKLPTVKYHELRHPDGYSLNVKEILPANFDPRKKYPVLFDPYGGPGAQQVAKVYTIVGWRHYIASDPELEYVIVTVDNRGTGFKGRVFRSFVARQLGKLEAEDQVWAAKEWAKRPYVDGNHLAIWGWSFGGYLTSKVIETNSGVFSLGLITAPVSDWRFYDSMYTERYMKTLEMNPGGYKESAVRKPEGFKNVPGSILIQHGTGDDNVHFQHSAVLVDTLTLAGVPPQKMDVQWFTDSDHNIRFHSATTFLYKQLTGKLWAEKNRKEETKHQWSRRWRRDQ
ncbi:putative dipeptidyl peptidase 4 [Sphaerosporella brunnea]|uniref:dipeptidyl-peptidase IV n=1 Tax=Sphaerosporella brunnea TaxID=1250544 RepID=A0A5J5EQG3_9PEZI|nr:putative dipeptidyl peptidase 4 [Sphaerosporella brunnea]